MRSAAAFRGGEMSLMVRTPVPCWPQGKRFCRAVPPRTVFVHFQRAFRACAATDILVAGAGFLVPARVRICCIAFPSQKGMTACSALVRGYGAPADSSAVPDRTSISNRERLSPWGCVRFLLFQRGIYAVIYRLQPLIAGILAGDLDRDMGKPAVRLCAVPMLDARRDRDDGSRF